MTVLSPGFAEVELTPVGDWRPARFTRTLTGTEDFTTEGDKLLAFVDKHWRSPETDRFVLDDWQRWLIRHLLETYPPWWPIKHLRGQLRYRQIVVSVARQNGKSVIGAILAFYFLALHVKGPRVVGTASVESQAKIVYDRVRYAVENNEALLREIKPTASRGIQRRDGSGAYQTLPAKESTAQGEPITGCLYDELHLGLSALWDALVQGQKARRNSLLVGITTAGDSDSLLLKRLYGEGEAAMQAAEGACRAAAEAIAAAESVVTTAYDELTKGDERFGFFVWESETAEFGPDYEPTEADVIAANPAVACGRVDLVTVMSDTRKLWRAGKDEDGITGRDRAIRYVMNRFVDGASDAVVPLGLWRARRERWPADLTPTVYAIERTDEWTYATITAHAKTDGTRWSRVVAQLVAPDYDRLVEAAARLAARDGAAIAVDSKTLRDVGKELKARGIETWILGATEMEAVGSNVTAALAGRRFHHHGDAVLTMQIPHVKKRTNGETWRLSRTLSVGDTDAVFSTFIGAYVADVREDIPRVQLF